MRESVRADDGHAIQQVLRGKGAKSHSYTDVVVRCTNDTVPKLLIDSAPLEPIEH